jgi:hypothetical protein
MIGAARKSQSNGLGQVKRGIGLRRPWSASLSTHAISMKSYKQGILPPSFDLIRSDDSFVRIYYL